MNVDEFRPQTPRGDEADEPDGENGTEIIGKVMRNTANQFRSAIVGLSDGELMAFVACRPPLPTISQPQAAAVESVPAPRPELAAPATSSSDDVTSQPRAAAVESVPAPRPELAAPATGSRDDATMTAAEPPQAQPRAMVVASEPRQYAESCGPVITSEVADIDYGDDDATSAISCARSLFFGLGKRWARQSQLDLEPIWTRYGVGNEMGEIE